MSMKILADYEIIIIQFFQLTAETLRNKGISRFLLDFIKPRKNRK